MAPGYATSSSSQLYLGCHVNRLCGTPINQLSAECGTDDLLSLLECFLAEVKTYLVRKTSVSVMS